MEFCKSALPLTWRKKKSINGQVVLITGAGGCLGSLLAQHFTRLGARLVLWDLDETANNITAEKCRRLGCDEVFTYTVNIANRDEVYSNAKRVKNEVGDVSILINNAGILHARFFMETDDAKLDQIIDVNTKAHFWTVKAFLPSMLVSNSGHIVSLASLAGFVGAPGLVDYSTSKFAAIGFMEALANELIVLGKQNIKTTIVCPAFVRTNMISQMHLDSSHDILEPSLVAEKIVNAVFNRPKTIAHPKTDIHSLCTQRDSANEIVQSVGFVESEEDCRLNIFF